MKPLPRRTRLLRGALLALGLAAPLLAPCRAALAWEATTAALSAVSGDAEAVAVFRFTNAGAAPVTVTSLSTSCPCTTAEVAKDTYAPGEAGEVRVVFTVGGRAGRQEKFITVATGERAAQPTVLTLDVDIRETVSCEPRLVQWARGGAPAERPVDIVAGASEAILGVAAAPESAAMALRVEILEPGRRYRLWVRPVSTAEPGVVSIPCVVTLRGRPSPPLTVVAEVQ